MDTALAPAEKGDENDMNAITSRQCWLHCYCLACLRNPVWAVFFFKLPGLGGGVRGLGLSICWPGLCSHWYDWVADEWVALGWGGGQQCCYVIMLMPLDLGRCAEECSARRCCGLVFFHHCLSFYFCLPGSLVKM